MGTLIDNLPRSAGFRELRVCHDLVPFPLGFESDKLRVSLAYGDSQWSFR